MFSFKGMYCIAYTLLYSCRIKQRHRQPDGAQQSMYLTPQTGTDHPLQVATSQTNPGDSGANGSLAVYENDNNAYVNITNAVTVPEYAELEKTIEYSNTAHIYSDLK